MQPDPPLQPKPDADAVVTLRTMEELLTATGRLRAGESEDSAAELVEVLYAVRDIIVSLGAATSRCAAFLASTDGPTIDMLRFLDKALHAAGLLAGQAATSLSDTVDAGPAT